MNQLHRRYAQVLLETLTKAQQATVSKDVARFQTFWREHFKALRILFSPQVTQKQRLGTFYQVSKSLDLTPPLASFLAFVAAKKRLKDLDGILTAFINLYNQATGLLDVNVTTAIALDKHQEKALQDSLQQMTGKIIQMKARIDPDILGGVNLRYGSFCFDATVRTRLDKIQRLLSEG